MKEADKNFDMKQVDSRLSRLYTGQADKQQTYDTWAGDYDHDLVNELGYVAHKDAAKVFDEVVPDRNVKILDVACGTGLVGMELRRMGYGSIDGTDFSNGMLEKARECGCYRTIFQHDFTRDLDTPGNYDALICVGLFSFDIPRIEHMIHVIRTVKSGAPCVITVNGAAWAELNLEGAVLSESKTHGFTIEAIHTAGYIRGQGIDGKVLVLRSPE